MVHVIVIESPADSEFTDPDTPDVDTTLPTRTLCPSPCVIVQDVPPSNIMIIWSPRALDAGRDRAGVPPVTMCPVFGIRACDALMDCHEIAGPGAEDGMIVMAV